jgi:hypothetical protein
MLPVPQPLPETGPERWTTFMRGDLQSLIEVVQCIATSGDAGAYGYGVEVIVESPTLPRWERLLARPGHHHDRDRAHIAVTDGRGRSGHPVHIRLYTTHGPAAGRHLDRRPGWATSNTAGQAILMMKARATTCGYDAVELATGTVNALADLHGRDPVGSWRFRVERAVVRR